MSRIFGARLVAPLLRDILRSRLLNFKSGVHGCIILFPFGDHFTLSVSSWGVSLSIDYFTDRKRTKEKEKNQTTRQTDGRAGRGDDTVLGRAI